MRKVWRASVSIVAFGSLTIGAACEPNEDARVDIIFKQLAYFHTYQQTSGATASAGDDGAYVMYRILSIRNDGPGATTYHFDPKNLRTVADGFGDAHPGSESVLLGQYYQEEEQVASGESMTALGCVIIKAISDNLKEDFGGFSGTGKKVDLIHVFEEEQPVEMDRTSGNETGFTGLGPADAQTLQNICAAG